MATTIRITRGDKRAYALTITYPGGALVDLTGATVTFAAKRSLRDSEAALISKTSPAGGVTIGAPATNGVVTIAFDAVDTAGLADAYADELLYDIRVTNAGGAPITAVVGRFVVMPKVRPNA